jgi:hypothetical protein
MTIVIVTLLVLAPVLVEALTRALLVEAAIEIDHLPHTRDDDHIALAHCQFTVVSGQMPLAYSVRRSTAAVHAVA